MKFHINIKFRAFGVTFGQLDQKIDGSLTLGYAIKAVMPLVVRIVPAAAVVDPGLLVSQVSIAPHVIYDDRGVLLEVVAA